MELPVVVQGKSRDRAMFHRSYRLRLGGAYRQEGPQGCCSRANHESVSSSVPEGLEGRGTHVRKIKGINIVAHVLATPGTHARQLIVAVSFGFEPLLYKHDLRVMVAALAENSSTTGPWRHDPGWDAESGASVELAKGAQGIFHPLTSCAGFRMERSHSVTPTTSF